MMNNCLRAYWCVGISLPLQRGREVGQSGFSALASGSLAAWAVCSARGREAKRKEGNIKARQGGRRGAGLFMERKTSEKQK